MATPKELANLIEAFFIFTPQLSVLALAFFPPLQPIMRNYPSSCWGLLIWITLLCSAGTSLVRLHRKKINEEILIGEVVAWTGLFFVAHVLVAGTIIFAGCILSLRGL